MISLPPPRSETCFFERDPETAIARRATAEGAGTLLLVLAASGAGSAAARLAAGSPELMLIASAIATAGALVGLIIAFGEVSGGHFNPLITGLQWLTAERPLQCTLAYVAAQCAGGIAGALIAKGLFDGGPSATVPFGVTWPAVLSEVVASAGLMIVVFCCARSVRKETGPFAVGAWLLAAIVATPSTSYANPAIAIAALFAAGPINLSPSRALAYVPAEIVGALIALIPLSIAYPQRPPTRRAAVEPRLENAR